jgi:hypothetical protein
VTRDITIQGALSAFGAPSEPITFTGVTPTPGLWSGLNFVGTPEQHALGNFSYATIEYAGYGGSSLVSIENANVTFDHCTLRNSVSDAIKVLPGQLFTSMPDGRLAMQTVKVAWSSLYNIDGYAIANESAQAVLAAYNWWGATSGPTADGNPGGTGSELIGLVDYWPYLLGPKGSFIFLPLVHH